MRTIVIVLSLYFLYCSESNQLTVKVTNPADIRRAHETTWQEVLENWRARFDHPLEILFEK